MQDFRSNLDKNGCVGLSLIYLSLQTHSLSTLIIGSILFGAIKQNPVTHINQPMKYSTGIAMLLSNAT